MSGSRVLFHRWFFAAVVFVGVALALPSLLSGFVADDYIFLNRLQQAERPPTWQLYEFATGEPGQHDRLMHSRWVAFPWWMADGFKVRFLRPLSSGLFALDHALFGNAPLGYHAHCLLWYALLLVAVGLVLRAVCSPVTWQLAFALFAVCASHAEAAAWISSRHLLISTTPALFGLAALISHRERGFRPGLVLGCVGMALGLLGGEAALSVAFYWLAYEGFAAYDARTLRERVSRLAAPVLMICGYVAVYKWLGYGTAASAAYLDPISTPRAFVQVLPARLAMLLAELFTGLPSGLALTTLPVAASAVGLIVTLGLALMLRALWPQLSAADRRALRWLTVGAALAIVVNAGAFLGPRLVLIPGVGAFVVISTVLRYGWRRAVGDAAGGVLARRALFALFALVHVALAPLGLALNCYLLGKLGAAASDIDTSLDAHLEQHRARSRQSPAVFILAASDPFSGFYAAAVRATREPAGVAPWSILSMARARHRVERTAGNQLIIGMEPSMLRSTFEGLFRATDLPFKVGDRAELVNAVVSVLAVDAGRPTAISLTLGSGSFDDPDVCLLAWRDGRLVPVQLALHETLDIPWSPGPAGLL